MTEQKASTHTARVAIVGGGPAGLMAAERLCAAGVAVDLYDAMPSLGRKFLMAGKSGLNLTHGEPFERFLGRFGAATEVLGPALRAFPPEAIRAWAHGLGVETFVGSSGRVFPAEMKAAPLLRAWLRQLRAQGLRVHVRHRWTGWDDDGALTFATPDGAVRVRAEATILALGGASWPRLGSDGAWVSLLAARGVAVAALQPANCGFDADWSEHMRERAAGQPLKGVRLSFEGHEAGGECMLTDTGLEGGPVYMLSGPLRAAIARDGVARPNLDLAPDLGEAALAERLARPRGKKSMATHLKRTVGLSGAKATLLREGAEPADFNDPARLAARIKALPLTLLRPRPIAEAISTAGGIAHDAVSGDFELTALPGTYAVGEMLDWDAPTGGYLLTACLATGRRAGDAVARSCGDSIHNSACGQGPGPQRFD